MAKIILDKKRSFDINLCDFPNQEEGLLDINSSKRNLKRFANNLKPGNLCVVEKINVSGHNHPKQHFIFKVGDQGLFVEDSKKNKSLAIDVQRAIHPVSQVKETVILDTRFSPKWNTNQKTVSLFSAGVSTSYHYNEGTFSPAPGDYIPHDSGSYINSIFLDQRQIEKDFAPFLEELKLRSTGIPFVLPEQYFSFGPPETLFGDLYGTFAADKVIRFLRDRKVLENSLSREEIKKIDEMLEVWSENPNAQQKGWRTRRINIETHARRENEFQWELRNAIGPEIRSAVLEGILLNSIGSVLNSSNAGRLASGHYAAREINSGFEEVSGVPEDAPFEERIILREPRYFQLVISKFRKNIAYAFPEDKIDTRYVLKCLNEFNVKFPDTRFIEEAKQNFYPVSIDD